MQTSARKDFNVVLDLDNTLICAEYQTEFPFGEDGAKEKALKFRFHDMDGYYIVFERPGVQEFLDELFDLYNVSVWTAASKDYAIFIIKEVILKDKKRKLDYAMFSHHCDISKDLYNKNSKDLRLIHKTFGIEGHNKSNTVIIDDLPEVYKSQPSCCIPVKAFEFFDSGSYNDVELKKILQSIRKMADQALAVENGSVASSHGSSSSSSSSI